MPFDDYKLSDEMHERVLNRIRKTRDKTPVAHPQVYILGGQPGAGKSVLTESVMKNLGDDNIFKKWRQPLFHQAYRQSRV